MAGVVLHDVEVIDLNAGGKPNDDINYADASTEWWATLVKELQANTAGGKVLGKRRMLRELSSRKYHYLSNGKMKLESKEEMRKKISAHQKLWLECF